MSCLEDKLDVQLRVGPDYTTVGVDKVVTRYDVNVSRLKFVKVHNVVFVSMLEVPEL
jgi:hypothetical protein